MPVTTTRHGPGSLMSAKKEAFRCLKRYIALSCELRAIGAVAIDAPATLSPPSDLLGVVLTRSEALSHPLAATLWTVVDAVGEQTRWSRPRFDKRHDCLIEDLSGR